MSTSVSITTPTGEPTGTALVTPSPGDAEHMSGTPGASPRSSPRTLPEPRLPLAVLRCLSGLLAAAGAILAACVFSYHLLPRLLSDEPVALLWPAVLFPAAAVLIGAGIGVLLAVINRIHRDLAHDPAACAEPERSMRLYGEALVGVGAALLIDAIVSCIILSGIIRAGHRLSVPPEALALPAPDPAAMSGTVASLWRLFGRDATESTLLCAMLLLAALLAILGALFFFSTALWEKLERLQESVGSTKSPASGDAAVNPLSPEFRFSERMFWAGLWFRIGEAVTFSLVLFLLIRQFTEIDLLLLPLLALLVGMFLKAGERLITGIAMRLFAAFEQLVPGRLRPEESPRMAVYQGEALVERPAEQQGPIDAAHLATPADVQPTISATAHELITSLRTINGVTRARVNPATSSLRVEYLASKVSPARIEHELAWFGLDLEPVA